MIIADLRDAVDLQDYNKRLKKQLQIKHGKDYTNYLDAISRYSSEIESYREIGTWQGASTSAILLDKVPYIQTIDIDLNLYNEHKHHFDIFAKENNINYLATQSDSLTYPLVEAVDFTLIDGRHNPKHVFKELLKYSTYTTKYIMLHDTTLVPRLRKSIDNFMRNREGWKIKEVHELNVGYTVLEKE